MRMSQAGLLKSKLQVSFVNEQGLAEAGIDGGGLWKEFVDTLTKRGFDTEFSLFKVTPDGLLYPCPASQLATEDHLEHFEFLGQVIGKALYGNGRENYKLRSKGSGGAFRQPLGTAGSEDENGCFDLYFFPQVWRK